MLAGRDGADIPRAYTWNWTRHFKLPPHVGPWLRIDEWNNLILTLRSMLRIPDAVRLTPGMQLGLARLECTASRVPSFEWPELGTTIVTQRTVDLLASHDLTGWRAEKVIVTGKQRCVPNEPVYELVADRRTAVDTTPPYEPVLRCVVCGRVEYPEVVLEGFRIDPGKLQGSDFTLLGPPFAQRIYVSERAAEVLTRSNLINYELTPIETVFERSREFIAQRIARRMEQETREREEFEALLRRHGRLA
jgi:hypothetical protein